MSAIPLWQRGVGLVLLLAAILLHGRFELTEIASVLAMIGAYLATRALLAIALAAALISLFFAERAWPFNFADYVLLAAGSTVLAILAQRFRARMQATHDARWSARRDNGNGNSNGTDNHQ